MTYQTPELQLVGAAKGIVLGFAPSGLKLYHDNGVGNTISRSAEISF